MTTATKKKKLQAIIEDSDDKLISLLYALAKEYNADEEEGYTLSEIELRELEEDRAAYERGEGKNYSWEEVKKLIKGGKGIPE